MGRPATRNIPAPTAAPPPAIAPPRVPVWLLAVLLVLVTLVLYWPVTGFDFINYDDPVFVTANTHVQGGLNWEGVKWAFSPKEVDNPPLTWLSLMLDASLFGQRAGGFHFTNVAFHAVNGALLFLLLRMLTGTLWRSVLVAALFALHPLRVESVAWVTERKDVLSGCFGLLALICYARYARGRGRRKSEIRNPKPEGNPKPETRNPKSEGAARAVVPGSAFDVGCWMLDVRVPSSIFYLLSLCFFYCGLMSKAMLVTWPFVMLLLDYWPLRRMQNAECRMQNAESGDPQPPSRFTFHVSRFTPHVSRFTHRVLPLLFEKIPFFVLSGFSCVATYLSEGGRSEVKGFDASPALLRLQNALAAYARYLGKTFWPVNLAVPYMNPGHWPWLEVVGSVLVVGGVWLAVLWLGRRRPCLLVGWCWFFGTLIPVIGLTKGWGSFMADRFTYLPSIGLLLLTVWGAYELIQGKAAGGVEREEREERGSVGHALARSTLHAPRSTLILLSVVGGAAIGLCAVLTRQQMGYWKDSETLFRHVLEVTENNDIAHNNLGVALDKKGEIDEAITQLREATRLKPDHVEAHYNLGIAFGRKGQIDEAITQFREALGLNPNHVEAYYNLGIALGEKGQTDEAIRHYQAAIYLEPGYSDAHNSLGVALRRKGLTDQAIQQFQEALRLKPDDSNARRNLDAVLAAKADSSPPPVLHPRR